jgi:hypothetical protein
MFFLPLLFGRKFGHLGAGFFSPQTTDMGIFIVVTKILL